MSTFIPSASEVRNDWYVLDAEGQILGRLATRAAMVLMGKHKPDYTPFLKTGDHVVVINAAKAVLTGAKEGDKTYYRHTQYPGGLKATTAKDMRSDFPQRLVENAVYRMLPKNKLGRQLRSRLKVYAGAEHPHEAQEPKPMALPAR
ncbi:MAG: 50S ribosomal protein L13 [Acidobacteria bacterium]|nr:50S ribosomal protein L13 [Acidobacteriota bacterium]